jgi:hypothetical protein
VKLEYRHTASEDNTSDPSPGSCTIFNVTRKSVKKREVEGSGTASHTPGATFRLNVVKEQDLDVTYASEEWKLHVLKKQDVDSEL